MPRNGFLYSVLAFGYSFLYGPIALLIVYSFNDSRLVTVWDGFSTRWYRALLENDQLLEAALLSLEIALATACGAVVVGALTGLALARFGRFRGRSLLGGMVTTPLVMPEVMTGLSLLLLFVALEELTGWPADRGPATIAIAHTTFAASYVAIIVKARLAGMDSSLEEAALDLGARPFKVFRVITLPLMMPALVAGWLLAFTLSLDDLVIASFVAGPGATTLPMVVFSSARLGVNPQINALATLVIVVVTALVILAGRLMREKPDRS